MVLQRAAVSLIDPIVSINQVESRMALDAEVEGSINASFVLIAGFLCFLLQAGFGLLEVGSVREKVRHLN